MPEAPPAAQKLTKGERTALRIMDVAEELFARQGYDGTSLRQIAEGAGIQEPGLYNHFSGKQGLYEAVLYRALNPMAEALGQQLEQAEGLRDYTDLPAQMTDLLLDHPRMAALFQQALQGDSNSIGNQLMRDWLDTPTVLVTDMFAARCVARLAERLLGREPDGERLNAVAEVYLEVAQMDSAAVLSELGSSA